MKKADLKIGETYACFNHAGEARSRYRYISPFKATLKALSGTITRTQRRARSNGEVYETTESESGILVTLAEPRTVRRVRVAAPRGWGQVPDVPGIGEEYEEHVTEIALENAGCFLMTWDEWLVEAKQKKANEERRAHEREEQKAQAEAEAPAKMALIEKARALLRERIGGEFSWDDWREQPERYEYAEGRVRLTIAYSELHHGGDRPPIGARVSMPAETFLDLVEGGK